VREGERRWEGGYGLGLPLHGVQDQDDPAVDHVPLVEG
jgi:hypothetical protein